MLRRNATYEALTRQAWQRGGYGVERTVVSRHNRVEKHYYLPP